jgi:DNA polymerase/3'-5' exonuclease PolX
MDNDIRNVYGIGAKKAMDLRKHYNIRTVGILRKYVRKIPDIVSDAQRVGLKYHDRISKHISWAEADKHAAYITKILPNVVIAGSYRRKARQVGDIDVLTTGSLDANVKKLTDKKYIVDVLSMGEHKFSGIVKLPNSSSFRRIDIVKTTPAEKPFALLYFTGDFVQNITMRQRAKSMKYMLSQHGLRNIKTGRYISTIRSEKDIFDFLKIPYKTPAERQHSGKQQLSFKKFSKKKSTATAKKRPTSSNKSTKKSTKKKKKIAKKAPKKKKATKKKKTTKKAPKKKNRR